MSKEILPLKDCPFCGMDRPDWCDANDGDTHWFQCRGCQATSEQMASKQLAREMWNTRTPALSERLAAEMVVEAARELIDGEGWATGKTLDRLVMRLGAYDATRGKPESKP